MKMNNKWDKRFIGLAEYWAKECSKDPSTQVGSVITIGKDIVSLGYNGFPPGIEDTKERLFNREVKYKLMKHAEENAIHRALQTKFDLSKAILYVWSSMGGGPCINCMTDIIRSGIKEIVYPEPQLINKRYIEWKESIELGIQMCKETEIILREIKYVSK